MASDAQARVAIDLRPLLKLLAVLVLLAALYHVRQIVFLVMFTIVFSAAIYPAVRWIAKRGVPMKLAILLTYLLLFGLLGTALYFAGDLIVEQAQAFGRSLPSYVDSTLAFLQRHLYLPVETDWLNLFQAQFRQVSTQVFTFLLSAVNYVVVLLSGAVGVIIVLALSFYLLSDVRYFKNVVVDGVPERYREKTARLLEQGAGKLGDYIRGLLIVMSSDGVMAWIGLSLIGVPYAFLLGVLTFVLNTIPIIGSTLAGILVVIIAVGHKPILGLWALLLYLGIQTMENYVLTPNIMGKTVQLHPAWVMLSVLIGGTLFGLWGILLAVPSAVIIRLLIHEFYIDRHQAASAAG